MLVILAGFNGRLLSMDDHPLNVALVGYGYAGKTFHAPLIAGTPGMSLTSVVSSDRNKVLSDHPEAKVVAKPEDAFLDPDIDLVVIATPNTTHFDLARDALKAGKHVVVDKPIAISRAEAAELFELARKVDRVLSVFQNRRWDADFLTLRKIVQSGALGEITFFQSNFDRYRPEIRNRWREHDLPGSGLWYDLGSHLADQVVFLWGAPDTVHTDLCVQREGGESIDYFHSVLTYGKRRVILHGASLVVNNSLRYTVHGTKGSYIKHGLDTQEDSLKIGAKPGSSNWGLDPNPGTLSLPSNGSANEETVPNEPGNYTAYYESIHRSIRSGHANPIKPEEALTVMRIIELGIESAMTGKVMDW